MAVAAPVFFSPEIPFPSVNARQRERGEIALSRQNLRVARLVVPPTAQPLEHRSPDDVVLVVVRGSGMITIDGTQRRVKVGDALDVRPGAPHTISAHDEMEIVVVHARLAGAG